MFVSSEISSSLNLVFVEINMQLYDIPEHWKLRMIKPTMDFDISYITTLAAETHVVFMETPHN